MKDFWAEGLQNHKKNKIKKLIILMAIIAIIIAIIVLIIVYLNNLQFRRWCDENILIKEIAEEKTKSIEIDGDENTQIYAYDKYIFVIRKKKLEFYNKMGTKAGEVEIDVNKAIFASAGRYMAICEENGKKFYLICEKEKIYENEIEGNITQINVSRSGYVSIVISNTSYKTVVDVYNRNGKEVFRNNLVTSRVVDTSISQDSKYLAIAEVDISGILIKSNIQIISMETAQTNPKEAIIYRYEAPTGKLILNIEYQERENLVCMYNDSIEVIQSEKNTELAKLEDSKIAFMTIDLSNRVAILKNISTGEYTSDTYVNIINPTTLKQKEYITNDVAKAIVSNGNKIAINFGTELHIINTNGILIKKYISDTEINDVVITDSLVGIIYKDKIRIVDL